MTSFAIHVYADEGELEIQVVQWRSNLSTHGSLSISWATLSFAPNSGVAPLAAAPQYTSCSSADILEKDGDGAILLRAISKEYLIELC